MKKVKSLIVALSLVAFGMCGDMMLSSNVVPDKVSADTEYSVFDVNRDGTTNILDLIALKRYLLGAAESNTGEETALTGTLVRVVDGDTYILNINGEDTRVRLIGVDTPESVAPESYHKENTEEGVMVSDIVKEKLKVGDVFKVEYDVQQTDRYNRTLAYLYFEDGTMIQEWLLVNGYAQVMTVQPNSKYADRFVEMEHKAMENKVGLWVDADVSPKD